MTIRRATARARDIGHHEIREVSLLAGREDRHDVRVVQPRRACCSFRNFASASGEARCSSPRIVLTATRRRAAPAPPRKSDPCPRGAIRVRSGTRPGVAGSGLARGSRGHQPHDPARLDHAAEVLGVLRIGVAIAIEDRGPVAGGGVSPFAQKPPAQDVALVVPGLCSRRHLLEALRLQRLGDAAPGTAGAPEWRTFAAFSVIPRTFAASRR